MDVEREERLYDEYIDLLLTGDPKTPAAFLAERGLGSASDLRDALAGVYREYQSSRPAPSQGADEGALPYERLGEFRLLERLGEGGMGVVYLAEQESLDRRVALKIVRPEYSGSRAAGVRFDREARSVARLHHPGIVAVHAFGEDLGVRYIAMEYVPGTGLDELLDDAELQGKTVPTSTIVEWIRDVARALAYAHAEGIVHRDLKPSNIRISPEGRAMLLDFGLARELEGDGVTFTEAFVGSPFYAAPEQVAGREGRIDGRTDVYALGALLYRCLTQRTAFEGGSMERVLHRIVTEDPPPPRSVSPTISRDLEVVILKSMEKSVARRYSSAEALAEDLTSILEHRPIRARPLGPVGRTIKWARRHSTAAAAIATALLVIIGGTACFYVDRHRQGRQALESANALIDDYQGSREATERSEEEFEELRAERFNRFFAADEERQVDGREDAVARMRSDRIRTFYEALDELRRAERLGADPAEVMETRGRLYLVKFLEAELQGNTAEQKIYARLTRANDPRGALEARLVGSVALSVSCSEPVETHLFSYREHADLVPGGEHRRVAVPIGGTPDGATLGAWCLRVVVGSGPLRTGDLVVEIDGAPVRGAIFVMEAGPGVCPGDRLVAIDEQPVCDEYSVRALGSEQTEDVDGEKPPKPFAFERNGKAWTLSGSSLEKLGIQCGDALRLATRGGVEARVWSRGAVRDLKLPSGLGLRWTAIPHYLGAKSRIDPAPRQYEIACGEYMVVLRSEDDHLTWQQCTLERGAAAMELVVPVDRARPSAEFVRIPGVSTYIREDFWMLDREVTVEEYLEFLNDPETLAEVEAAGEEWIRIPRDGAGPHWERGEEGLFELDDEFQPRWPILDISWDDARAYVEWRNRRARAAGEPWVYDLPTRDQWSVASNGRPFPFGNRFRPKWVSSCFARPIPNPEPVRSFPIDESIYGIFDMCGSVSEWLDEWWLEDRGHRFHVGGSWGYGGVDAFRLYEGNGMESDRTAGVVGFRLVARPAR